MKSEDTVAQIRLLRVSSAGTKLPVEVRIAKPYYDGKFWKCPVYLEGFHTKIPDICGMDSLQSLCLAIKMVGELLLHIQQEGDRVIFEHDEEEQNFPFEAYFGKLD